MKRLLVIFLTLLLLFAVFVSCNNGDSPAETTDIPETSLEESETEAMPLVINPSDYIIVYPSDGFKEKYFALLLSNTFQRETEANLPYRTDTTDERECEILIGKTNRAETQAMLEDIEAHDLIIKVVGKKIIIWASEEELYDAAVFRLMEALALGNMSLPSDFCIIADTLKTKPAADSFAKNTSIGFTAELSNSKSAVEIRIGDVKDSKFRGYVVEFTAGSVALYKQENKRTELAKKVVISEIGKKYNIMCSYDGEYIRAYLSDPELDLEPWAAFEIKASELSGAVYVCEATGYGALLSAPEFGTVETLASGTTYQNNVIMNAADPDIIYHEGYYYMYVTGDHYPVYRSADLAKWELVGVSLLEVSWNIDKRYMWAPDVEYINGKFYMAVSMGEAGFGIAVADRPEGPFVCAGDMPFLTKTIDGHIFVDEDGRIYLYYTSWCDGRAYGIWGVEMEADCLTPKWETEKLIFTPTEDWESSMNMGGIVEAPYMLKKDGVYYMVYSGSNYQADYAVGYATSTKPLEGFVKSANNPILRGTADTRGTGHCSIIETPAGGMVMVYHVHNTPTAVQPRHVAIDPVRFVKTADGYRLEVCGPTTSKVPIDIFGK